MPDRQEQWAVFWCSLLSPLLYGEIPPEETGRFLRQLASIEQVFPDGRRGKPSRATLWRKWKQYRDGGFEALFRKRRSDRGKPRKTSQAMIAKAVELKTEQPYRSNVPINQFLDAEFHATIPKSTLYRHLKQAGATRLKLGINRRKVRRRWTREESNASSRRPKASWKARSAPAKSSRSIGSTTPWPRGWSRATTSNPIAKRASRLGNGITKHATSPGTSISKRCSSTSSVASAARSIRTFRTCN